MIDKGISHDGSGLTQVGTLVLGLLVLLHSTGPHENACACFSLKLKEYSAGYSLLQGLYQEPVQSLPWWIINLAYGVQWPSTAINGRKCWAEFTLPACHIHSFLLSCGVNPYSL